MSDTRYEFGANWLRFSELVDEARIARSTEALREALQLDSLEGLTLLDVGSGSGLSSLAAHRMGAAVTSFDYDELSVRSTNLLREKFSIDTSTWKVFQGSVLDPTFMGSLEAADVVYSWGVLHHTGDMNSSIRMAANKVRSGGLFCVALYRKTLFCPFWKVEKRFYGKAPTAVRGLLKAAWVAKTRASFALKRQDFSQMVREYGQNQGSRGMDYYRDVNDWLGGYPYESITPAECRDLVSSLGFELVRERAVGEGVRWALSSGCDEWLFRRAVATNKQPACNQ